MSVSYASSGNYSSNIIAPKTQSVGPDMSGTQIQTTPNKTFSSTESSGNQAIQLTPEQLYEMEKAKALQAMFAAGALSGNQTAQAGQSAEMQALVNAMLDIPSGFTADGFTYGLARLAHNLSLKRGEVNFVSATKINDKQYYVVCQSRDSYANGTFLVDIFPTNENELKDGYQIWFTLYDINAKKLGTAQAEIVHN